MTTEPARFTANPFPGYKPRVVRGGSVDRYTDALNYVRMLLEKGDFVSLSATELANAFKISSSFLVGIYRLKGVERRGTNNRMYSFRALPRLATLTAVEIIDELRVSNTGLADRCQITGSAFPIDFKLAPIEMSVGPGEIILVEPGPCTYIIGRVIEGEIFGGDVSAKFEATEAEARQKLVDLPNKSEGVKYTLLQVIETVEPSLVLKPSTL